MKQLDKSTNVPSVCRVLSTGSCGRKNNVLLSWLAKCLQRAGTKWKTGLKNTITKTVSLTPAGIALELPEKSVLGVMLTWNCVLIFKMKKRFLIWLFASVSHIRLWCEILGLTRQCLKLTVYGCCLLLMVSWNFRCDMGGDCECLCTAIANFAEKCNEIGAPTRWRHQRLCRKCVSVTVWVERMSKSTINKNAKPIKYSTSYYAYIVTEKLCCKKKITSTYIINI